MSYSGNPHTYLFTDEMTKAEKDRFIKLMGSIEVIEQQAQKQIDKEVANALFYEIMGSLVPVENYHKTKPVVCEHCGFIYKRFKDVGEVKIHGYKGKPRFVFTCSADHCGRISFIAEPK